MKNIVVLLLSIRRDVIARVGEGMGIAERRLSDGVLSWGVGIYQRW